MKPLRVLAAAGLLCAMAAVAFPQPVVAAENAAPQAETKEAAKSETDTQSGFESPAQPSAEASAEAKAEAGAEAAAEPTGAPSATVDLASDQVRLIMGGTAGKGTLHYQGKDYPFTFKTASAGVGLKVTTSVSATGEVFSLGKVEDFAGQYSAVSQAVLAGSSEKTATYKSDKGVVVKLRGTVKGAGLSLGAGVATIKLVTE